MKKKRRRRRSPIRLLTLICRVIVHRLTEATEAETPAPDGLCPITAEMVRWFVTTRPFHLGKWLAPILASPQSKNEEVLAAALLP